MEVPAEIAAEVPVEIAQEIAQRAEEPVKPVDGPTSARIVRKATKAAEKAREPDTKPAQEKSSPAPAEKPKRARKVKPSPAPEPTGPVLSGATVRVKIAAASWSMLSRERRADLTLPMDGVVVDWREGEGVVYVDAPVETVAMMRKMAAEFGVELKVQESAQEGEAA